MTRADAVDADAGRRELAGERLRQCHDTRFRRSVGARAGGSVAAEDGAEGDAAADSYVGFREGDAEEPLYIQPDGDLLAGPLVGYAVRWELEQIADKVSDELVNVYRLSAKSIGRACEEGRTEDGIRRFLERASGCPLPPAGGAHPPVRSPDAQPLPARLDERAANFIRIFASAETR